MLAPIFAAVVAVCIAGNNPPNTPVVTEPAFDGRVVNAEDVHMETAPFSDPNPGDSHAASDWEIWTVTPSQRVWAALGVTGPEKIHIHLGDGVFQGSHAGRTTLLPSTNFLLRARHKDASGDPLTEWSLYGQRTFVTGPLSSVFPLEMDDVLDAPVPTWLDTTNVPAVLPAGTVPGTFRLESAAGEPLLVFTGAAGGQNQITNPPSLAEHVPIRVRFSAGDQTIILPETNLRATDHTGVDRTVYLPAVSLSAGQSAYFWVSSNGSTYVAQAFQTQPDFSTLARGAGVPWNVLQPGYRVEIVASGFQLPVNIAVVPSPGPQSDAPMFYVTELYGQIKVVRRNGTVGTYASGLINFNPTGAFPGSGEQGLTGIVVDPVSGDVFAGMLYDSAPPNGAHYPKVVRFHSNDGGQTAATATIIRNMTGETQGQSHQISNFTIAPPPDGKLYVHMGDGFTTATAQNLDSYRGKILRMNFDGTAPTDNPFYDAANGISARDYVYAYGVRNPFGGCWRDADGQHYEVENGPSVDRFAKIVRGRNYLWSGSDASMANFALYNWNPSTGPVNIAFIQASAFGGSQFPASKMDHAFVSESGPTYGTGPQTLGKRISEFVLDAAGNLVSGPTPLIEYNGSGKATCVGLAAGPDGLYFTDLYKDVGYTSPIDPGANLLRVRFVGAADFTADVTTGVAPLTVQFTDLSTVPSPTQWHWSFGDGATSDLQNPTHVYGADGLYNVRLSVTGAAGAAVLQRNAYIRVGTFARIAVIAGAVPPGPADQAIAAELASHGFTVHQFDDDPANRPSAAALASNHELVLVSSTVSAGNIAGEFRNVNLPVVFWEQGLLRTAREALADNGVAVTGATAVTVVNATHPITQGMPVGNTTVYNPAATMSVGLGNIAPAATILARRAGVNDAAMLAAEQGAVLLGGYVAPARRVFLFLEDASYLSATPAAMQLLERAVCWAGRFDPVITVQPSPASVIEGQPAGFTVVAGGAGPLSYQWRRNGAALANGGRISGATSSMLVINPTITADAGTYDAVISGPCGDLISAPAALTVGCYANCDGSTVPPILNVNDFVCFQSRFASGDPYANCDGSTTPPVLNVNDFICFQQRFAAGCQ